MWIKQEELIQIMQTLNIATQFIGNNQEKLTIELVDSLQKCAETCRTIVER